MKQFFFLTALVLLAACATTHQAAKVRTDGSPEYDQEMAEKIGADEYGMKKYVIAFLKQGPNRELDSTAYMDLMRGHMDNIQRMAKEGKLAVAGPFMDDGELRGIYIFNVESIEEAKELTETDPAIRSGALVMELHPWYGSAAVSEISERHKIFAKKTF